MPATKRVKHVWVYKNIRTGLYSIMKHGKVIARRKRILLVNVTFKVREAGRQRVIQEKRKNVHAFAIGDWIISGGSFGTDHNDQRKFGLRVHYNPYKAGFFYTDHGKISGARGLLLNENGMQAVYTTSDFAFLVL